jgi:hypothetical protein
MKAMLKSTSIELPLLRRGISISFLISPGRRHLLAGVWREVYEFTGRRTGLEAVTHGAAK